MATRTSTTHPLRVDFIPDDVLRLPGRLGLTFAPGKRASGTEGRWERDLGADLARLRSEYRAEVLVSLLEDHEFGLLQIEALPVSAADVGIALKRFAIPDGGVPADGGRFVEFALQIREHLRAGKTVVIHCRGGLGRTGVLAAVCLRTLGIEADRAIALVRAARAGTIENATQEDFVRTVAVPHAEPATPSRLPTLSQFRGCLLGGALGDSLGEPMEFIGSAKAIASRFGTKAPTKLGYAHGPFITDDTQMTLFAAEGIIRAAVARRPIDDAVLVREVQAAFLRWLTTQDGGKPEVVAASPVGWLVSERGLHERRAPGTTCLSALRLQIGAKTLASVGSVLNESKGCGAVMRAAPFGLAADSRERAFRWARDTGAITHGHPSGHLSAGHFAAVLWGLARGEAFGKSVDQASTLLAREPGHEETSAAVARALLLVPAGPPSAAVIESLGGAWVGEEALAIALLCAGTCEGSSPAGVAAALWRAVAHGGDSDSTGSMVGHLLGATYGVEALPAGWLAELELRDVIDRVASDLRAAVDVGGDAAARPKTEPTRQTPDAGLPTRPLEWLGVMHQDVVNPAFLAPRAALADAAKASDWAAVFEVLKREPALVNTWRIGGTSWFTPLHQAAHGGAPPRVVEKLLALGAWRALTDSTGQRAVDLARDQGHLGLVPLLEPRLAVDIEADALRRIQEYFHAVIRVRVGGKALSGFRLPELAPLTEFAHARFWFGVPSIYGGFLYWLENDGRLKLIVDSSGRMPGESDASDERHEVTAEEVRVVAGGSDEW